MLCTPVEFWRPKRVDTGPIAVVSVFRFSTDTTRSPQMSSTSQHMRSTSPLSERVARIMTHIGPRGWKDPTQRHTQTYTAQQQHHLPAASMDFKVFLHTLSTRLYPAAQKTQTIRTVMLSIHIEVLFHGNYGYKYQAHQYRTE